MLKLDHSVTGMAVVRYPPGSVHVPVGEPQLCVVFASTPGRLYQFVGKTSMCGESAASKIHAAATALREGFTPGIYGPIFAPYFENLSGTFEHPYPRF